MKQQPLQLTESWKITYNEFYEIESEIKSKSDQNLRNFKEDMLQIENRSICLLIDLGWYPEFAANGQYKLMLIELSNDPDEMPNNHENPLKLFCSRDRGEIVRKIEKWVSTNGKS